MLALPVAVVLFVVDGVTRSVAHWAKRQIRLRLQRREVSPLWAWKLRVKRLEIAQLVGHVLALEFCVKVLFFQVGLRLRLADHFIQSFVVFVDSEGVFDSVFDVQGLASPVRDGPATHYVLEARHLYVLAAEDFIELLSDDQVLAIQFLLVKCSIEFLHEVLVVIETSLEFDLLGINRYLFALFLVQIHVHLLQFFSVFLQGIQSINGMEAIAVNVSVVGEVVQRGVVHLHL